MKIDTVLVKHLRNKQAWSQEELAVASGLNLRTIQRIEKEGSISLQSKKALASVYNLSTEELDYIEPESCYEYKTVIFKSDVTWLSGWSKKNKPQSYQLDEEINAYAKEGWRIHTLNHGSSVHGGAGQVSVLFERLFGGVESKALPVLKLTPTP